MKVDLRHLTHKELTRFREQAVSMVQSGRTPEEVHRVMGVARSTLFGWLSRYRQGGWHALKARKRGGRRMKMDASKIQWVYETVRDKNPEQLKLPFALWTCPMIAEAIWRKFKIRISRWSVMRLLRQLGLTPQRPLHKAYQQDSKEVARWKKEQYPKIRSQASRIGAKIYFGDESAMSSNYHSGTTWAIKGRTPVVKSTGRRYSINIIAAISPGGTLRFKTFKGNMTAPLFIEFLSKLMKDVGKPVFLIVDGHPVHRSAAVRDFVAGTNGRLRLFLLPVYSPELNPVEQAWNHSKNHNVGRRVIEGINQLRSYVISAMRKLQKTPSLVAQFFKHPDCIYITR